MTKKPDERKQIISKAYQYLTEDLHAGAKDDKYYLMVVERERKRDKNSCYRFYGILREYPDRFMEMRFKKSDVPPEEKERIIQQAFDFLIEDLETNGLEATEEIKRNGVGFCIAICSILAVSYADDK